MGDNFNLLCDELLLEILRRIPSSSSPTISLVCCRWLNLHRSSKTILSVRLPPAASPLSLSSLLSHYPFLSSLTLIPHPSCDPDSLLLSISSSNLSRLRFLAGPTSPLSLQSQSSIRNLTSLSLSSLSLLSFRFLIDFPNLRDLAVLDLKGASIPEILDDEFQPYDLPIETLSLSGIGSGNLGLGWLWLSCRRIRRLRLRSCEGTGDLWEFAESVAGLVELELRTCRTIADRVLFLVAQESASLNSLVLYDGGSRDGLLNFLTRTQSRSSLRKLDLRLPLDLEDDHLVAISGNFGGLSSVKLQSCCLVTGLGLEPLGPALSSSLEELVLVNCDAVEREPGLLTSLGQNLRKLKKLDLSYNEMLMDKELGSMLESCGTLVEIRLRGCGGLTDSSIVSMIRSCKVLEVVDIRQCRGIGVEVIEVFLSSLLRLGRIMVEESKLTDSAKMQVSRKIIQVG